MEKIHWSGGINLPKSKHLKGWPACVSGRRAEAIRRDGMMNGHDPAQVTCERCQALLRKVGLI